MDISKAFDTINHELLIAKLEAYGFDYGALEIIHSYLTVASNDLAQLQTSLDFELEHLKSSIKIQNILELTRFDIHNS